MSRRWRAKYAELWERLSPEERAWHQMKTSCEFKRYYLSRRIMICERWLVFANFLADVGPKPEPQTEYSLRRIDPSRGYEPGNVEWRRRGVASESQLKNNIGPIVKHEQKVPPEVARLEALRKSSFLARRLHMDGWSNAAIGRTLGWSPQRVKETVSSPEWWYETPTGKENAMRLLNEHRMRQSV